MEKLCKVCQYRGETAETACPECGAPLFEAPPEEIAAPPEEVGAFGQKKPRHIHLPWGAVIALFLVVCLALEGGLLWLDRPPESRFIPASERWCMLTQWPAGTAFITRSGVEVVDAPCFGTASADQSRVLAREWSKGGYYLWDGEKVEQYGSPADLSGNGRCLFYQKGVNIFRKELDTGTSEVIDQAVLLPTYNKLFPSWDGTAVAYFTDATQDKATLRVWTERDGVEELELDGGVATLNVGTQGKTLMLYRLLIASSYYSSTLPVENQIIWRETGRVCGIGGRSILCDRDLTEWIYRGEDGELVYDDGGEPVPLDFDQELYMCRPGNGAGIDRLTNWFYQTQSELYFFHDDLTLELLAENVQDVAVDPAGRWLYYMSEGNVYRMDHPMSSRRESVQLTGQLAGQLAGDLRTRFFSMDVAPDGESVCYFTVGNGESALQRISSDGTQWPGMDEPVAFVPLNGGVMWALTQEGEAVYAQRDEPFATVEQNPAYATHAILEASPAGDQAILTCISDAGEGRVWRLTAEGQMEELLMFTNNEVDLTTIPLGTATVAGKPAYS